MDGHTPVIVDVERCRDSLRVSASLTIVRPGAAPTEPITLRSANMMDLLQEWLEGLVELIEDILTSIFGGQN